MSQGTPRVASYYQKLVEARKDSSLEEWQFLSQGPTLGQASLAKKWSKAVQTWPTRATTPERIVRRTFEEQERREKNPWDGDGLPQSTNGYIPEQYSTGIYCAPTLWRPHSINSVPAALLLNPHRDYELIRHVPYRNWEPWSYSKQGQLNRPETNLITTNVVLVTQFVLKCSTANSPRMIPKAMTSMT